MYQAKFVRGSRTLTIDGTTYRLEPGFSPPSVSKSASVAGGTSANRLGGGEVIGTTYTDREFTFVVQVTGTTREQIAARVRALTQMIEGAGDTLYFEYRDNASLPVPLWGQFGAPLRYEVLWGIAGQIPNFLLSEVGSTIASVTVQLAVKPFALGRKQRLASALGGVWEDTTLTEDGSSLGLRIEPAVTNKYTYPVFGFDLLNDDWTAAASLFETENLDPAYCFEGSYNSAYLTAKAATNNTYTQTLTLTAVTYYFYALVARQDGEAVTSNDVVHYYNGAALTSTFTALGRGLYLMRSTATGVASALATGVQVKSGRSIYLIGAYCGTVDWPCIGHGNMLGWSWASTALSSASSNAAGRVRVAVANDTFLLGQWGVHIIWRPDFSNTAAGNRLLFSTGLTNIRGYFFASDDKFYLTDDTNTISTAAQTFAAGDKIDLIFTGGPNGLAIYKNGVSVATGATYTPPAALSYLYIGTSDTVTLPAEGVFLLAETYGQEISQAEATAIYTAAASAIASGLNVSPIPWHWIADGDDIYDYHNDSTHKNWGVAAGIPGDSAAVTELWGYAGGSVTKSDHYINVNPMAAFYSPNSLTLNNAVSTGTITGAQFVGGGAGSLSLGTAHIQIQGNGAFKMDYYKNVLAGKNIYHAVRFQEGTAAAGFTIMPILHFGDDVSGVPRTVTTAANTVGLVVTNAMYITDSPGAKVLQSEDLFWAAPYAQVYRAAGAGSTPFYPDTFNLLPGRVTKLYALPADTDVSVYVNEGESFSSAYGGDAMSVSPLLGDPLLFDAHRINAIQVFNGCGTLADAIGDTFIVQKLFVTPRWSLL